jgi:hypothetical protein
VATNETIAKRLDKLLSVLLTSGLQQKDQPLFQVISQLIAAVRDSNNAVVASVGPSGGGPISDLDFVTYTNELAQLPNSRQLLGGTNVTLDTAVFGTIVIDVLLDFITDATFLTATDESANFPNSRELLPGTGITFDDTVPNERTINSSGGSGGDWSVLTNGDVLNPELIFAGGDVIMTHTP